MTPDLTFMESHRYKIKQNMEQSATQMFFLALFLWGNPALGKVRGKKPVTVEVHF